MFEMSAVSGEGVKEVLRALKAEISEDRLRRKPAEGRGEEWHP